MTETADITLEAIIARLHAATPAIKAEGVTSLAVFGSRARRDEHANSDLDILIDIPPDQSFSILNLVGVEHIVRDATGLNAHATTRGSLDTDTSERIADDLIEVF